LLLALKGGGGEF